MINEQDYIKTEKDDGTIIFTPKKKEVTGERERLPQCSNFFFITDDGRIQNYVENSYPCNDWNFNYWNYYHTKEQAQAVADLRRHVYKFQPTLGGSSYYVQTPSEKREMICLAKEFSPFALPLNASPVDKEERTRLIKRCYELNGYVSI